MTKADFQQARRKLDRLFAVLGLAKRQGSATASRGNSRDGKLYELQVVAQELKKRLVILGAGHSARLPNGANSLHLRRRPGKVDRTKPYFIQIIDGQGTVVEELWCNIEAVGTRWEVIHPKGGTEVPSPHEYFELDVALTGRAPVAVQGYLHFRSVKASWECKDQPVTKAIMLAADGLRAHLSYQDRKTIEPSTPLSICTSRPLTFSPSFPPHYRVTIDHRPYL